MAVVALAVRVVAAVADGAHLAHRPTGVVHIVSGPLTPSGRFAAAGARTACHPRTRTRRLSVIERLGGTFDLHGRRFCRRCTAALCQDTPRLVSRDDWQASFGHLTAHDLLQAAAWTRTVAECHQVGYLASVVLGPGNTRQADQLLARRRNVLARAERTPEEVEAAAARREAQQLEDARVLAARTATARLNRALDRRTRGAYLMPHERELLDTHA